MISSKCLSRLVLKTDEPPTQIQHGALIYFIALGVGDNAPLGASMDWGLDKHLLVPNSQNEVIFDQGFQKEPACTISTLILST